jgi:hypothetical protein
VFRIYFIPQDIEQIPKTYILSEIDETIGGEKEKNER